MAEATVVADSKVVAFNSTEDTTFSSLQTKLDYFLDDAYSAGQARRFPLPTRLMAWNWAQKYFVNHTPREQSATLSIGTGGRQASLPDDFLAVKGIYDSGDEYWWREMEIKPGDYRHTDSDVPEFWIWGDTMYLERGMTGSTDLTLYYWAYYPSITYTIGANDEAITYLSETIYTPSWAELPLCYLTTAICWHPGVVLASDINEWRIMVDAGTPMHNPRQAAAREALWWYNHLLGMVHPSRGIV
jgi:hypothetical protein